MKRLPLRLLLPLGIALFALLGIGATLLVWWLQERQTVQEQAAEDLAQRAAQLRAGLEEALLRGELDLFQRQLAMLGFEPRFLAAAAIDPQGRILAAMDRRWQGRPAAEFLAALDLGAPQDRGDDHAHELLTLLEAVRRQGAGRIHLERDGRHLVALYPLRLPGEKLEEATGNLLLAEDLFDDLAHSRRRALVNGAAATLPMLLLALLFYALARRRVVGPVERLARTAETLGKGDLDARSGLDGEDELGRLGRAFDTMAEGLARTQRALDEERARLQAALDAITDAIIFADEKRRIRHLNPAAERLFGHPAGELHGHTTERLYADPADYQAQGRARFSSDAPGAPARYEMRYRRRDGSEFIGETHAAPVRDGNGRLIGFVAVFRDVTERRTLEAELDAHRRHLETLVEERTRELRAVNEELESFAYSVSHDLRAPLRAIDGFSLALMEDCHERLDENGRDYLERIRGAAQRMGDLIDDLLKLSRVTRTQMRHQAVDLGPMAKDIAAQLAARDPERNVEFHIPDGITVRGDPALLRVALENLLDNAWKYTAGRDPARIRLLRRDTPRGPAVCVEDNGAGFAPRYAHKLFKPFQRLHHLDEFPGTGIGLATVARIVHRHGGEVWAEGRPGQGAVFCFTLATQETSEEPDDHEREDHPAG